MASLEIDIGNSRTKYRCGEIRGHVPAPTLPVDIEIRPARIRVSAVKGDHGQIRAALLESFGVEPEWARVRTPYHGVTCAYEAPERLGVDRWLAVLAAWELTKSSTLVCDVGTAITLDYVDAAGVHRGGWIAPGIATMRRALRAETRDVRPDDRIAARLEFGRNTDTAVAGGTLAMAVGAVLAARRLIEREMGEPPRVLMAGGDAEALIGAMGDSVEHHPDLVFDGLEIALP